MTTYKAWEVAYSLNIQPEHKLLVITCKLEPFGGLIEDDLVLCKCG